METKSLICMWFAGSVLSVVVGQVLIYFFLLRRGVKPVSAFSGAPIYADILYAAWCRENNKPFALVLALRAVSLLSAIISAIVFNGSVASQ